MRKFLYIILISFYLTPVAMARNDYQGLAVIHCPSYQTLIKNGNNYYGYATTNFGFPIPMSGSFDSPPVGNWGAAVVAAPFKPNLQIVVCLYDVINSSENPVGLPLFGESNPGQCYAIHAMQLGQQSICQGSSFDDCIIVCKQQDFSSLIKNVTNHPILKNSIYSSQ